MMPLRQLMKLDGNKKVVGGYPPEVVDRTQQWPWRPALIHTHIFFKISSMFLTLWKASLIPSQISLSSGYMQRPLRGSSADV